MQFVWGNLKCILLSISAFSWSLILIMLSCCQLLQKTNKIANFQEQHLTSSLGVLYGMEWVIKLEWVHPQGD
jgi:hypothetical protein